MTVNGLVASSFLDFLSFLAMLFGPPVFCLPYWADARIYAHRVPMSLADRAFAISFETRQLRGALERGARRKSGAALSKSTSGELFNGLGICDSGLMASPERLGSATAGAAPR
jgi:hypothetical protein